MKSAIFNASNPFKNLLHTPDLSNAKLNLPAKHMDSRQQNWQCHLKWAFSEAAVLYLRGNTGAQQLLQRFQKRMSKAKALSALAHKLGRAVYFMLKNEKIFDEQRFLKS